MNATVASLTSRSLLGRKRTLLLTLLPLALLALCTLARILANFDPGIAQELDGSLAPDLLGAFGIAIMLPLLGLVAGTGAIGPEIDEGSIVYLLAKPINRYSIVVTKLVVAVGVIVVFGLVYALVWESLVGGLVPGAQTLSVQQWSLAVVKEVLGDSAGPLAVDSAVGFGTGAVFLALVTVLATAYAGRRLQVLRLTEA
jgi:ABC-2 type transport system permease protein